MCSVSGVPSLPSTPAPAAASAWADTREWWRHSSRSTGYSRPGAGGMITTTAGLPTQEQTRRACRSDARQSTRQLADPRGVVVCVPARPGWCGHGSKRTRRALHPRRRAASGSCGAGREGCGMSAARCCRTVGWWTSRCARPWRGCRRARAAPRSRPGLVMSEWLRGRVQSRTYAGPRPHVPRARLPRDRVSHGVAVTFAGSYP